MKHSNFSSLLKSSIISINPTLQLEMGKPAKSSGFFIRSYHGKDLNFF